MTTDSTTKPDYPLLKKELTGLFQYIKRVRQEIAAISRPADEDHRFTSMGEQLDAIVKGTEAATDTIMECMEENTVLLQKLKDADSDQAAIINELMGNTTKVIEACAFQDLTGQRISKVIKSVIYVEDRVNALSEVWGREELEKVEVKPDREKTKDEKLMHGPQDPDKAISQVEIDALFD